MVQVRLAGIVSEMLFWTHLAIIVFALTIGLYAPALLVLALALLHRSQTWLFGGCLFSKIERKLGSFDQQTDFLRHVSKRLFGLTMTSRQSKFLDYSLLGVSLSLATAKTGVEYGIVSLTQLLILAAAAAGLIVSIIITKQNKSAFPYVCSIGGSCGDVLTSRYATVKGVKISELGIVFYTVCLAVVLTSFWLQFLSPVLVYLGLLGFVGSVFFVYLQAFVIKAWCRLCLTSASSAAAFCALVIVA